MARSPTRRPGQADGGDGRTVAVTPLPKKACPERNIRGRLQRPHAVPSSGRALAARAGATAPARPNPAHPPPPPGMLRDSQSVSGACPPMAAARSTACRRVRSPRACTIGWCARVESSRRPARVMAPARGRPAAARFAPASRVLPALGPAMNPRCCGHVGRKLLQNCGHTQGTTY